MSELNRSPKEILNFVIFPLGNFINQSESLKCRLRELQALDAQAQGRLTLPIFGTPLWCQIMRWWRAYRAAWTALDDVEFRGFIHKRWDYSTSWIDEARGAMYLLTVPFFIERSNPHSQYQIIQSAYKELEDLDAEIWKYQGIWSKAIVAANEKSEKEGLAMADNAEWRAFEATHSARTSDWSARLDRWAERLEGHPYAWRFASAVRDQNWESEFDRRLARVEERTATLAAVEADAVSTLSNLTETGATITSSNLAQVLSPDRCTKALVFTDIVDSTAMASEVKDEQMREIVLAHFAQGRRLAEKYKGQFIKNTGDGVFAAFWSVDVAIDYAIEFHRHPGHAKIQIRAGIHIGSVSVVEQENDLLGINVNRAARVVDQIDGPQIWLSDEAKKELEILGAQRHRSIELVEHPGVVFKGIGGPQMLWSVAIPRSDNLQKS